MKSPRQVVGSAFPGTPLDCCEALVSGLERTVSIKPETANPLRSFAGHEDPQPSGQGGFRPAGLDDRGLAGSHFRSSR
jgi:hypothetical protein